MIYIALLLTLFLGFGIGYITCLVKLLTDLNVGKEDISKQIQNLIKLPNFKKKPNAFIFYNENKTQEEEKEEEEIEREERILEKIKPMPKV